MATLYTLNDSGHVLPSPCGELLMLTRRDRTALLKTMRDCYRWMSIECEGQPASQMRVVCPELARLKRAIAKLSE